MDGKKTSTFARRGLGRRLVMSVSFLVLLVVAAPYIIAKSPLRNVVLSQVGAQNGLQIEARAAEFGWLTPLQLRALSIHDEREDLSISVDQVRLDQSWFATLFALPDLGKVSIDSPEIEISLPMRPRTSKRPTRPILGEFVISDASFSAVAVEDANQIVRLDHLDVTAQIEAGTSGRMLTIEPVVLLDQVELSPQLCDRGLQLIAPMLANSTAVSGTVSLELLRCQVPLPANGDGASAELATVTGTLQLHQVQTSMKDSVLRDVAGIIAGLLQKGLPDEIRVADGTEVHFELKDRRVYHEGMAFLLPEVSKDMIWRTSGTVGLDDSLDLTVQAQLPFTLAGDGALASRLTERPIELHIGGTLDKPKLELPKENNWLQQAAGMLVDNEGNADLAPLTDTVIDLFEKARERREAAIESGQPTVLDRMRERLKNNAEKRRERFAPSDAQDPDTVQEEGGTNL